MKYDSMKSDDWNESPDCAFAAHPTLFNPAFPFRIAAMSLI